MKKWTCGPNTNKKTLANVIIVTTFKFHYVSLREHKVKCLANLGTKICAIKDKNLSHVLGNSAKKRLWLGLEEPIHENQHFCYDLHLICTLHSFFLSCNTIISSSFKID